MNNPSPAPATRGAVIGQILAESPELIPHSKTAKDEGYGGIIGVGLIVLALLITIAVFFWRRRGNSPSRVVQEQAEEAENHEADKVDST